MASEYPADREMRVEYTILSEDGWEVFFDRVADLGVELEEQGIIWFHGNADSPADFGSEEEE